MKHFLAKKKKKKKNRKEERKRYEFVGKTSPCCRLEFTCMLTFSKNFFVISTSLLKISFLSSRPRLLGLSSGSGFKFPSTIDTFMLSGISAFVVSASRFSKIFSRSSVSGFDGSIKLSASVGLLPQNDVSSKHLCGLGDLIINYDID